MPVIDIGEIKKAHSAFVSKLNAVVKKNLIETARDVQDRVIADDSFKGNKLRHSIRYSVPSNTKIKVYTSAKHASFVEDGTRPHVIRARRAKTLAFYSETLNRFVFPRSVNHPGTKPTKFFSRAVAGAEQELSARITEDLRALSKQF